MNYIAYYRVSTEDQGKSGLGLSSQRELVRRFIKDSGTLIAEYEDIESGASDSRKGLLEALAHAKSTKSVVVVKELSRITRGDSYKVQQLFAESGVLYTEAYAEHDSELVKTLKVEFAKEELRKIKQRTKDALNQIKKEINSKGFYTTKEGKVITTLGSPKNLSQEARNKSIEVRREKARTNDNNTKAGAMVILLRGKGLSYPNIAKELNQKGFKTSRGGEFNRVQAQRLHSMYKHN